MIMENNIRHIVFDTETTGFSYSDDRVTEVGCVELIDMVPTGRTFHIYANPNKVLSAKITEITGLTNKFLSNYREISYYLPAFLDFIGDSMLVAHNSDFDMNMINAELRRARIEVIPSGRFIDTVQISKEKFPGKKHNLDQLCKRLNIPNEGRGVHTAIYDALLLTKAFIALDKWGQEELELEEDFNHIGYYSARQRLTRLKSSVTKNEAILHKKLVEDHKLSQWKKVYRAKRHA